VLLQERIEADALARLSSGRFDVDLEDVRAEFDQRLMSEPEVIDADKADLMRALGVGPWRRSQRSS
jgi:hypothetical protein